MFCSIIIPTIGRPSLSKSVDSALKQHFPNEAYEIIVVNDSGKPLPAASWQETNRVQIIHTQKRERCFARNVGAAVAKGTYFCFLDDDDWLLPDALQQFSTLATAVPDAGWLYGTIQFVDGADKTLGYLNQGKSGNCFVETVTETWIPLPGSLVKAEDFFLVGGFDPYYIVTQDLDLLRRISLEKELAHTSEVVTCARRHVERGGVTQYSVGWRYVAQGRDAILHNKHAFSRLLDSADESPQLHGFILQNYIRALRFNLRQQQWSAALGKFGFCWLTLLKSCKYLFSGSYWQAVRRKQPLYLDYISNPSPDYDSVEEWLYG